MLRGCVSAQGQAQDVVLREPHRVRLERVTLNFGDEVRLVGADLETAVAAE
jgi:hypothetical protein